MVVNYGDNYLILFLDLGSIPGHANNYIPQSGIEPNPIGLGKSKLKYFRLINCSSIVIE